MNESETKEGRSQGSGVVRHGSHRSEDPRNLSPGAYGAPYLLQEEDEIDLADLWRALVYQRTFILLVTLLFTSLAGAYVYYKTPVYRAQVVLSPVSEEKEGGRLAGMLGEFGGLASLAGIDLGGSGSEEESIATLKSRRFSNEFISENSLLPILFDEDWDAKTGAWAVDEPGDIPSLWDAYELFDEEIRGISRDKKTGLVTLSIEWKDRHTAARWANELVDRVNRDRQQEAIAEAERSIAYLTQQLDKTTVVELQQAIYRLIEAQTKKIMLANVRDEYAFKVIDPAVAPDADDFEKPKRPLVIALGMVGGMVIGVLLALLRHAASGVQREEGGTVGSGGSSPSPKAESELE